VFTIFLAIVAETAGLTSCSVKVKWYVIVKAPDDDCNIEEDKFVPKRPCCILFGVASVVVKDWNTKKLDCYTEDN